MAESIEDILRDARAREDEDMRLLVLNVRQAASAVIAFTEVGVEIRDQLKRIADALEKQCGKQS